MRRFVRCLQALAGVVSMLAAAPAGVGLASIPSPFVVESVQPARGAVVGVAHPVVVTFTAPVANRAEALRDLRIASLPAMSGHFEWIGTDAVQWIPDRFWPAHSTIELSVGGRVTKFDTGPAVVGVANISDHTFTVRVDGEPAGPPSVLPAPHHRPHWGEAGVFPASMGRPEYPTPVGTFAVLAKERDVVMDSSSVGIPVDARDGYRLEVAHAVRLTNRGLFVHSAPWALGALGFDNVSHGCVSLSPEDAQWYFDTVTVGDPVIVQENGVEVPRTVSTAAATVGPS